ncbi:MAG: efflux RND transporter periplasmic adaptor subunit [Planctomycetota bacterium]
MSDAIPPKPDLARLRIDRSAPRPGGGRWFGRLVILLVLAAIGWAGWTYGRPWLERRSAGDAPAAAGPKTVAARALLDPAGDVSGNGYVVARRRAALSTVLAGRLVELSVEEGSVVEAGEVIARIQYDDYENALAAARRALATAEARVVSAEADVAAERRGLATAESQVEVARRRQASAETDAGEAEREAARQRGNFEAGVISESEYDRAASEAQRLRKVVETSVAELAASASEVARAQAQLASREAAVLPLRAAVAEAKAQIESSEILLDKTYVRAPFAGVIVEKNAEEGEVVAATGAGGNSRGSVATLVDLATLEVQIELPEKRIGNIAEGMSASVYLDASPRDGWAARVRQIWPKADRQKGSIEIRVVFEERPEVLRPDMGARVVFHERAEVDAALRDAVLLPQSTLRKGPDGAFVFRVEGDRVAKVAVEQEGERDGLAVIKKGLAAGDRILLAPPPGLADGDPIEKAMEKGR